MLEIVADVLELAEAFYTTVIVTLATISGRLGELAMLFPDLSSNEMAVLAALCIGWVILANGIFLNLTYLLQLFMAYKALRRRGRIPDSTEAWWQLNEQTLPMSILVPAYAEEATIVESVRSLLSLQYPTFEIIVVCDGSPDRTLEVLLEAFDLRSTVRAYDPVLETEMVRGIYDSPNHSRLLVIDKDNGGKADALNAAINVARCPLVCAVDADSILESDSLLRVVQPFVEDIDRVVAVGGTIRVANGCAIERGRVTDIHLPKDILSLFQIVEYLRAFLMARLGWSEMGSMMMISGAFGIFKRSVLLDVGGYSRNTVGEDMEVILKIHRFMSDSERDYEMRFIPEPVCWTEAPRNLRDMGNQRKRWARGSLESFFRHRDMLGRFRYGFAGSLGYLNILITDVLGPPLEVLGYLTIPILYSAGLLNADFLLAFLALTFVFGIFLSVGSLILEEMELKRYSRPWDLAVLTYVAVIENFGYRQLNNVWRVIGWWQYIRGKKNWGSMTRSGFS